MKISEDSAGYTELRGAQKDAICALVDVTDGVSSKLGCCNLFDPESDDTDRFSCGTCEYLRNKKEK